MITISRSKDKVIISIDFKYPVNGYSADFEFTCPSEFYAKLTEQNISDGLVTLIEEIRKYEYESGWSDAKKKKQKRTFFYSSLTKAKY